MAIKNDEKVKNCIHDRQVSTLYHAAPAARRTPNCSTTLSDDSRTAARNCSPAFTTNGVGGRVDIPPGFRTASKDSASKSSRSWIPWPHCISRAKLDRVARGSLFSAGGAQGGDQATDDSRSSEDRMEPSIPESPDQSESQVGPDSDHRTDSGGSDPRNESERTDEDDGPGGP